MDEHTGDQLSPNEKRAQGVKRIRPRREMPSTSGNNGRLGKPSPLFVVLVSTIFVVFFGNKIIADREACKVRALLSPSIDRFAASLAELGVEAPQRKERQWLICLPF